jgi:predicted MFS family arabinose efflux permease
MFFIFSLCGLASAISNRAMDPLVTAIARDFAVDPARAAIVVSAYALPYAFCQPVLGALGDFYGKGRMLSVCLWLLVLTFAATVWSPTLGILIAARFVGGIAGGGIMPIAMAMVGDRAAPHERQQKIGAYVSFSLLGWIGAAGLAGILATYISWRAIFFIALLLALAAAILVSIYVREPPVERQRMTIGDAIAGYKKIFANPRALICYGAVLIEGITLYGTLPWISPLIEQRGRGGTWEAGMIVMAFAGGAFLFTSTVKYWLRLFSRYRLMTLGGVLLAVGPLGFMFDLHWLWTLAFFTICGLGYMMLHNGVQAEVSTLAPELRGSAFSMHSCAFFVGQALGPMVFAAGAGIAGPVAMLGLFGLILLALGPLTAHLFRATGPSMGD